MHNRDLLLSLQNKGTDAQESPILGVSGLLRYGAVSQIKENHFMNHWEPGVRSGVREGQPLLLG